MGVLVGEHTEPAVLRLDGVVTGVDAGRVVRDLLAREGPAASADVDAREAGDVGVLERGVPAVRPDGVRTVARVGGRLVTTGVDDLHVVDEAVRLVEVAVAVDVVAVLLVEGAQVAPDRPHLHARVELLVDPHGQRVADERLGGGADHVAAVVTAVEGLVEGDLHPALHVTGERVATGRLALVVRLHPVEVHVLVVLLVVVLLPDRGVVDLAVGRRDLVVLGAVEALRLRVGHLGVVVEGAGRDVRRQVAVVVLLGAELDEDREDPVAALGHERDLGGVVGAAGVGPLALEHALERLLLDGVLLGLDRQRVLGLVPDRGLVETAGPGDAGVARRGGAGGRGDRQARDDQGAGSQRHRGPGTEESVLHFAPSFVTRARSDT